MERTTQVPRFSATILRVALGALAAWMVPFIASCFVPDWNWPPRAFILVYVLFCHTACVLLFTASALLFRHASATEPR